MDEQIQQQLVIGAVLLVVGLSGWLLPYRLNLLRLRKGLDRLASESVNRAIPKVIGALLALVGVGILAATALVGKFQ